MSGHIDGLLSVLGLTCHYKFQAPPTLGGTIVTHPVPIHSENAAEPVGASGLCGAVEVSVRRLNEGAFRRLTVGSVEAGERRQSLPLGT